MTAKQYLAQAKYLDLRINTKIEMLDSLNDLATRATATLTGMPRSPSPTSSQMADTIAKIVDLQAEINRDIDALVDLRKDIEGVIKRVPNVEHQTILMKRYLIGKSWEEIADEMNYTVRHLTRLHGEALIAIFPLIPQ